VWVDNGLTVVPIADVHANDGLGRMISAAVGQVQPQRGVRLQRSLNVAAARFRTSVSMSSGTLFNQCLFI